MKKRILFVLSLILVTSIFSFAQTTPNTKKARKTVTNADLEKFRQKRLQAEKDYRENYKRLGMPSPEELEQREAERQRWLTEYSRQARAAREQNENYLQARADELKVQIAAIDAQINYLGAQVSGNQSPYKGGTLWSPSSLNGAVIVGVGNGYGYGYGYRNNVIGIRRGGLPQRSIYVGPNTQTVRNYANSFPTTGDIRNQIYGTYSPQNNFPRRSGYRGGYVAPQIYGGAYDNSGDFASRLSYLQQQRAALVAEWQALEEEARRAGVRID